MSADLKPFRNSIVRIRSPEGDYVGLGYRLTDELVLTCAHVVAEALGAEATEKAAPEGLVWVDHPFDKSTAGDENSPPEASVESDGWFPKDQDGGPSDLALLRLRWLPKPPGLLAELTGAVSLSGSRFITYGGIEGHEETLVPIHGTVREPIANGRWQLGTDTEYTVEPGCSGAPAADQETGKTLGLIVQGEHDSSISAGFLIGAREIRQALEQAGVSILSIGRGLPRVRAWAQSRIPSPAYDEQQSVLRFIDYYAGRPDRPMPFAGRDDALVRLATWWAAESGSFLLVSGPAGMGKSALLLHWLADRLEARDATGVLFVPVSIRFGTSDELSGLRLLHAQLAGLFAELRFPPEAKPDPTDYRAKIQEGWRLIASSTGDRYLLMIDGADESAGSWLQERVLPYEIPDNLAIVLSARHKPSHEDGRAWLDAFTFGPSIPIADPLELEPLSRDAVGETITQLGHPVDDLVDRQGVLDELYRLTDRGDPLLVSLWASHLWGERGRVLQISVTDLAALEPSFAGFLDQWMEEQGRLWTRERIEVHPDDLDRLLGVLGVAHGPMRLRDLLEVEGRLDAPPPWDFRFARRVLDGAERLVVGDAEVTGYAFVHPRLADELRKRVERLGLKGKSIHRAFAEWGAEVVSALNSGDREESARQGYLLRHYTTHVREAEFSNEEALDRFLLPLLQKGWHRAWYEEEGSYSGYLSDLERVETLLEKLNQSGEMLVPRLGAVIRCVLIRSSITSLNQQLPAELVVALVRTGLWTVGRGLRVASSFDDRRHAAVVEGVVAKDEGLLSTESLDRALVAVAEIGDAAYRERALSAVVCQLKGKPRLVERARVVAAGIGKADARARALVSVADQLEGQARDRVLKRALAAAKEIEADTQRADALTALAGRLEESMRLEVLKDAQRAAARIEANWPRAHALVSVAVQSRGPARRELLMRALVLAEGLRGKDARARALVSVAAQLEGQARDEVLKRALVAARMIKGEWLAAHVLVSVADQLEGQERDEVLERALEATKGIRNEQSRGDALASVASRLKGHGPLVERALAAAEGIGKAEPRAHALASVAAQLEGRARDEALERALAAAESIGNEQPRADALGSVAGQLEGHAALVKRALVASTRIADEDARADALISVAGQLKGQARHEALQGALGAAEGIQEEQSRAEALVSVAVQLKGRARHKALEGALAATKRIRDQASRAEVLVLAAGQLEGQARYDALMSALEAADGIRDNEARAQALVSVAGQLEGQARYDALVIALEAADVICSEEVRAQALITVAVQLEGQARHDALMRALVSAEAIRGEDARADALASVIRQSEGYGSLAERALMAAEDIGDNGFRARALSAIAVKLQGRARKQTLDSALAAAKGIRDKSSCAGALSAIADKLDGLARYRALESALAAAKEIRDRSSRARALSVIASRLEGQVRQQALEEALAAAEGVRAPGARARALASVAGQLEGQARNAVLAQALAAGQLQRLKRHEELERTLGAAEGIEDFWVRADRLALMARHAEGDESLLQGIFDAITTPLRENAKVVAGAVEIASKLPPDYERLSRLLRAMGGLPRGNCMDLLRLLAEMIRAVGGAEAAHGTARAIVDTAEYWP